jgi:hypothetical protein
MDTHSNIISVYEMAKFLATDLGLAIKISTWKSNPNMEIWKVPEKPNDKKCYSSSDINILYAYLKGIKSERKLNS